MSDLEKDFVFSLSMNPSAFEYYSSLDTKTQGQINQYIQNANDTNETKSRILESINALNNNDTSFLFFL